MRRLQYVADHYGIFALAGLRTVERTEFAGVNATWRLKLTYKGYEADIRYGTDHAACDAMFQQLRDALIGHREEPTP